MSKKKVSLSALECSRRILEKKELTEETFIALELVDPDFVRLDLSSGGIKFKS